LRQRDRHHNNTSLFFIFPRTVINYCYYSLLWQTLIAGENLLSLMDFLPIAFLRSHFSRSSLTREIFSIERSQERSRWQEKSRRSCVPSFSRLSPIDHFNCIFLSISSIPNGCDVFTPHHLHVLLPFFCLLNTIILLFQVDASLVYCVCFRPSNSFHAASHHSFRLSCSYRPLKHDIKILIFLDYSIFSCLSMNMDKKKSEKMKMRKMWECLMVESVDLEKMTDGITRSHPTDGRWFTDSLPDDLPWGTG